MKKGVIDVSNNPDWFQALCIIAVSAFVVLFFMFLVIGAPLVTIFLIANN